MLVIKNFNSFMHEKLNIETEHKETSAYIVNIFSTFEKEPNLTPLAKPITLTFFKEKERLNFSELENIGNCILWSECIIPDSLSHASKNYYRTIAQLSYYKCYIILNKKWKLFEELADNYHNIIYSLKTAINDLKEPRC